MPRTNPAFLSHFKTVGTVFLLGPVSVETMVKSYLTDIDLKHSVYENSFLYSQGVLSRLELAYPARTTSTFDFKSVVTVLN